MSNWYQRFWLIAFGVFCFFSSAHADKWGPPKEEVYYSQNREFRLRVTPADFQAGSIYRRTTPPLHDPNANPLPMQFRCRGALEKRIGERYHIIWQRELVNRQAPVDAVVSEDGLHVATIDDWHGKGFGPHVVVLYNDSGDHIRSLSLFEFLQPDEIKKLGASASSLWWFDRASFSGTNLDIYVIQQEWVLGEPPTIQISVDAQSGMVFRDPAAVQGINEQILRCKRFSLWERNGFMSKNLNPFSFDDWRMKDVCFSL